MAHLIDKDALVAEIEELKTAIDIKLRSSNDSAYWKAQSLICERMESKVNSLEVKEVDLELITGWFNHIAQIADDRMTLTNQRMTDSHALDEIKCIAKNSSEFITKHYKAQKGE